MRIDSMSCLISVGESVYICALKRLLGLFGLIGRL